jgi:hypothetical protein
MFLTLRLPMLWRFCLPPCFTLPYFAIVPRMTAKLKMKPVIITNRDRSERSGRMFASEAFETDEL